ncbi:hypothetical protein [Bradyrhizobium yuanmingense]|uniref:hypothetical protein n=1 Tax=Bradyrhizobium yuanmingense TaxID=108015 RepID=UPI00056B0FC0|nr:hypothetical protein [Bradyrhizobium yuanmingense]
MASRERVYEEAGRLLELANLLETELGTALIALDALDTGSFLNPDADAYTRLVAAIEGRTLGASLHAIKKRLSITGDLEALFDDALKARNFMAHRLFPHYGLKLLDDGGRDNMVEHMESLHKTIWRAYTAAQHMAGLLVTSVQALAKRETSQ